jgi:hypothetical protein
MPEPTTTIGWIVRLRPAATEIEVVQTDRLCSVTARRAERLSGYQLTTAQLNQAGNPEGYARQIWEQIERGFQNQNQDQLTAPS